jgi:DamX protein
MSDANDFFSTTEVSARLDLVRHLIENSELVPLVRGPSGIGKTLLATKLQQLAPENWTVCHFEADPAMQPERLLATIARCSGLPDIAGELLQRLVDRFEVLRKRGRIPVLLVDDAQMLPPTSLITLLRLFERQLDGVRLVSMVLFADEQIDLLLSTPQLQVMSPQAIQVIDLPAMTRQEAAAFMLFLLKNEGLSEKLALDEVKLNRIYRETKGIPGLLAAAILNAVGENGNNKVAGPHLTGYKKQLLIGGLPLLLVVLLLMWVIGSLIEPEPELDPDRQITEKVIEPLPAPAALSSPESPMSEMAEEPVDDEPREEAPLLSETPVEADKEPIEIATLDVPSEAANEDALPQISTPAEQEQPASEASDEIKEEVALTEPALEVLAPAGQPAAQEQLVAAVDESDDKQQENHQGADGADEVEPQAPPEQQITANEVNATVETETPEVAEVVERVEPTKPAQEESGDAATSWVMSRPPKSYTLQLIAVENLDSLRRYIAKNNLAGETQTFRMMRKGKPWHALLWGEFADRPTALKAVSRLPARVQKAGVWPRTFESLQQTKAR